MHILRATDIDLVLTKINLAFTSDWPVDISRNWSICSVGDPLKWPTQMSISFEEWRETLLPKNTSTPKNQCLPGIYWLRRASSKRWADCLYPYWWTTFRSLRTWEIEHSCRGGEVGICLVCSRVGPQHDCSPFWKVKHYFICLSSK